MRTDPSEGGCAPKPNRKRKKRKHTYRCLAKRLKQLEPVLYACFPAEAADAGLDAARRAGVKYIKLVRAGKACELTCGRCYLRVIAFRTAARHEAAYLKREHRLISAKRELARNPIGDPTGPVEYADEVALLLEVVDQLPRRQREVLILHYLEENSLDETAKRMGISYGTAHSRVTSALANLRKKLAKLSDH